MASDGEVIPGLGRATLVAEGPFAGWMTWSHGQDPYETHAGPFVCRVEGGAMVSAFLPERRHMNGTGAIHGGALMSFADFALFSIGYNALKGDVSAVTLTLSSEFVGAGAEGAIVLAHGDLIRETGSLVFARGILTQEGRPLLTFSGTLKKIKNRA